MSQPELLSIPFARDASGATKNEIPDTPGGGAPSQQATWTQGFPAVTMQPLAVGGIPPQGQDFNGVLAALSEHTVFQNQGGVYRFDADFAAKIGGYPKGAVLQNDGGTKAYISTIDNNTDNFNAGTGVGTSWLPYSGGNASEAERGLVRIATTAEAQALTDDSHVITPKKLVDSGAVFPGEVRAFAGPVANVPDGWLPCNGATISRTTYSRLFAVIGTTYGDGDGSTTFNLPDLRGEFVRGVDNGRGVDAGRALGQHQADALQNITGTFWNLLVPNIPGISEQMGSTNVAFSIHARNDDIIHQLSNTSYQKNFGNQDGISFDASRVARTADETRPRNVAMNYIIKY